MPKKRATKPLTKAERFYIEQHCVSSDAETVAKDLRRSQSVIQKYYDQCLTKREQADTIEVDGQTSEAETQESEGNITAGDLMVSNKQRGYTVMTREASEVGEANRKRTDNILSGKLKGHIRNIKD